MNDDGSELCLRTLGERLRTLRAERDASLSDVADGTGLSTSFLSLVENGRSDISTGRLFRIARFLGVGLGDLLEMGAPSTPTVMRADERRAFELSPDGVRMSAVVADDADLMMAPGVVEYEVGAQIRDLPGMEGVDHFVFVAAGGIEISIGEAEPIVLGPGDCAYLRADRTGAVRNVADERSVVVWVSSPPAVGRVRAALAPGPALGD